MDRLYKLLMPILWASFVFLVPAKVAAVDPSDVWTASNVTSARFSADGTSALVGTKNGFQLRRVQDGRLESTILVPGPIPYTASAFSPDERYLALTHRTGGVTRIELWSVATGALERVIPTSATRSARGIEISGQGLIALFERFSYGGGGFVRLFRARDGAQLGVQGPYAHNAGAEQRFSPGGAYLAIEERTAGGIDVRILRTADGSTALVVGESAGLFAWSGEGSIWVRRNMTDAHTLFERIAVPTGEVLDGFAIDSGRFAVTAFTPDDRFLLATTVDDGSLVFLRGTDGAPHLVYDVPPHTTAGSISPAGSFFTYSVCTVSSCTMHMARLPSL